MMINPDDVPADTLDHHVLIIDDHGLLGQSLTYALRADGLDVGRCTDLTATGIVDAVAASSPDVVLLDLHIGGELGSSVSLIPTLAGSGTRVVMLTGITDRVQLAECIEAGAIGIIAKSEPFERCIEAVGQALEAGTLLSKQERDDYLSELRRHRVAERERHRIFDTLTPREAQALAGLMEGLSAEMLAAEWFVSMATVRTQIRGVLTKLGVNSQLSAVALARKAEWRLELE